jgi:DNA-binding PadR family transcriptional regulator
VTPSPLTPAVFYVLLALAGAERHGYAILKEILRLTDGAVRMQAGTLYGTLERLLDAGLVEEVSAPARHANTDSRRRYYRLTRAGRRALDAEVRRMAELVRVARAVS